MSNTTKFQEGDRVSWMHTTRNGDSFRFKTKEGVIITADKFSAVVKVRNGHVQRIAYSELTKDGEKNAVTRVFEAMTGSTIGPDAATKPEAA